MRLLRIGAYADNVDAALFEFTVLIPKTARFLSATRRIVFRVKIQHESLATKVSQGP